MTAWKRKLLPVEPYEIGALEEWFSDCSAEGLFLYDANPIWATFQEKEPKRMAYFLEAQKTTAFGEPKPDKATSTRFADAGWDFVNNLGRYFYIFSAEEGTASPYPDPAAESEPYPYSRSVWNNPKASIILFVLFGALFFAGECATLLRQSTYTWVTYPEIPFARVIWFILMGLATIPRSWGMEKREKALAKGISRKEDADWQEPKKKRKHRLYYVTWVLLIGSIFLPLLPYAFHYSDKPLTEVKDPIPYVSLAKIEQDDAFFETDSYFQRDDEDKEYWWERDSNVAYKDPTLGAPVSISYNQSGKIEGKTDQNGEPYEAVLWVDYRKIASFLTPQDYVTQNFDRFPSIYQDRYKITELTDTPFDYAVSATKEDRTELYLVDGQKLLEVDYCYGDKDITDPKYYPLYQKALDSMK